MQPAITNESQTAAPATSPAAPSSEKMPAPTIAPTPMKAACRMFMYVLVWSLMLTSPPFPRSSIELVIIQQMTDYSSSRI